MLFKSLLHPYTQALLSAVPVIDLDNKNKRILLEGDVLAINPPSGCRSAGRCAYRQEICQKETPTLTEIEPGHFVSCHFTRHLERHK